MVRLEVILKSKDEIVNEAINELQKLTKDDFHGHRSEIYRVIMTAMREQDRNTRHACAESVTKLSASVAEANTYRGKVTNAATEVCHQLERAAGACINTIAI